MKPSPSTSDRWQRVKAIAADVFDLPPGEHPAFLDTMCAGDETLRAEVLSLVHAHLLAGTFLHESGLDATGAAEAIREAITPVAAGRRVGPYRILSELGHGGMGVVYLAERADAAFEKRVAIKILRGTGLAGAALEQRFREERRILATLDHPNIARLIDGGTTDDGLPYFVMEHVDGIRFDAFCARIPSLTRRLELFHQVCAAVQYAHQHLVIHRDLKAGNILVTADGTPKLLDFGVARLIEAEPGNDQTRTAMPALTLEAASPEQIRREPLAVTSDVYALGVLLYRLLTARSPYGEARRSEVDLARAICDDTPERPSAVAPPADRRMMRGELDWIALKALRKEPDRRYASVEQLADDVERYLGGRPVAAAPDSWRYRARKLVLRNRARVAAVSLLAVSLVAGVSATIWQARRAEAQRARAERRFGDVRKLAASVMGEMYDEITKVPGTTAARGLLLRRANEHLDALARDAPDDPALAEEVATSYHRLGNLQGGGTMGGMEAARASHRKGLALRSAVASRSPQDLPARSRVVESLIMTGYSEEDVGASLAHGRAAVAAAESLVAARPGEARFQRVLAAAHYMLGSHHRELLENAQAKPHFEKSAVLFQGVHAEDHADLDAIRHVALCHKRLGAILAEEKSPEALDHLRQAVALDEARLAQAPATPLARRDVSVSTIQLGNGLQYAGDLEGALAAYRRGLALREQLARDDPKDPGASRDLAFALWWVGQAEIERRNWKAALATFERAVPLATSQYAHDDIHALLGTGLADALEGMGREEAALSERRRVVELRRAAFQGQPAMARLRRELAEEHAVLGAALARRGRWEKARESYQAGLDVAAGFTPDGADPRETKVVETLRAGLAEADARGRSGSPRFVRAGSGNQQE